MKRFMVIAAALVALGLAAVTVRAAIVSAQEGDQQGPVRAFISRLAGKLGMSEDELTRAMKDSRLEMIEEARQAGKLTDEQAARLSERVEEGKGLFAGRGRHVRDRICSAARLTVYASGQALDMTPREVAEHLRNGKTLADIAQAEGLTVEQFKTGLLSQVRAELDELVVKGRLTQAQGDKIFEGFQEREDRIVNAHPKRNPCGGWSQIAKETPGEEPGS